MKGEIEDTGDVLRCGSKVVSTGAFAPVQIYHIP